LPEIGPQRPGFVYRLTKLQRTTYILIDEPERLACQHDCIGTLCHDARLEATSGAENPLHLQLYFRKISAT